MEATRNMDIEIRIVRSNRKSIIGEVLPDGNLNVRAPLWASSEMINDFLDKYEDKFLPLVKRNREWCDTQGTYVLKYGGDLLFLGKRVPIIADEDRPNGNMAQYKNGAFVVRPDLSENEMRQCVENLLYDLAKPIYKKKLEHYANAMGIPYIAWTIGNARKRLGSCDSNGKITLSWRVIMMSEYAIDVLIVHELAHLKQLNHSKAFHEEVAKILPDHQARMIEYNDYAARLHWEGWL